MDRPSHITVWVQAARPKTLWAGVAPVLIGSALAWERGALHFGWAIAALGFSLLMQVGSNFCNDVADFKKGADTAERTGPLRVTQAGWVSPRTMVLATGLVFGLGLALGGILALRLHPALLFLVLLAALCSALYTAGPRPLGYLGLGDPLVFLFFGPAAVIGTYAVQTTSWDSVAALHGIPPGLLSVAILAVNNLRDRETDLKAGKRTLAVRFGVRFARMEYLLCLVGAVLTPWVLYAATRRNVGGLLTVFLLPFAWDPLRKVFGAATGSALNPVLGQTAKLLLLYAILFALGLYVFA